MWALVFAAAVALPARGQRISPDKFADVTLKLLSADANLRVRAPGSLEIAIVAVRPEKGSCAACEAATDLLSAFQRRATSGGLELKPRVLVVGKCSADELRAAAPAAAIVAVDFSRECAATLSKLTREKKILTVGTTKEVVDPLSVAVVGERNQVQIYRSDVALPKEGVKLSSEMAALTRSVSSVNYQDNFREAVRALDFRNWDEAIRRLNTAIDQRPDEGGQSVLIYGMRTEEYLPHYHLGVALYQKNGRKCSDAARIQWGISADQRKIPRSSPYHSLLEKYLQLCPATASAGNLTERQ